VAHEVRRVFVERNNISKQAKTREKDEESEKTSLH